MSYLVFFSILKDQSVVEGWVVIDGCLIISRGFGIVMEFIFNIVEKFFSCSKVQEVVELMVFNYV